MGEWVGEWVSGWASERVRKRAARRVGECAGGWVSERVRGLSRRHPAPTDVAVVAMDTPPPAAIQPKPTSNPGIAVSAIADSSSAPASEVCAPAFTSAALQPPSRPGGYFVGAVVPACVVPVPFPLRSLAISFAVATQWTSEAPDCPAAAAAAAAVIACLGTDKVPTDSEAGLTMATLSLAGGSGRWAFFRAWLARLLRLPKAWPPRVTSTGQTPNPDRR